MKVLLLFAVLAPMPKAPELAPNLLVGQWKYGYGGSLDGSIVFYKDGTYVASHSRPKLDPPSHEGEWELRPGPVLVLHEKSYAVRTDRRITYTFDVRRTRWPAVIGTSHEGVALLLTDPRRFD